jgi:hypothetical protein
VHAADRDIAIVLPGTQAMKTFPPPLAGFCSRWRNAGRAQVFDVIHHSRWISLSAPLCGEQPPLDFFFRDRIHLMFLRERRLSSFRAGIAYRQNFVDCYDFR